MLQGQIYPLYTLLVSHRLLNFSLKRSTTIFELIESLSETSPENNREMILNAAMRSKVPLYAIQVLPSTKFQPISLYIHHFWVTGHFETSAMNNPQMTLNIKGQRYLIYILLVPIIPKHFTPVCSTASRFQAGVLLGEVKRMAPKWP